MKIFEDWIDSIIVAINDKQFNKLQKIIKVEDIDFKLISRLFAHSEKMYKIDNDYYHNIAYNKEYDIYTNFIAKQVTGVYDVEKYKKKYNINNDKIHDIWVVKKIQILSPHEVLGMIIAYKLENKNSIIYEKKLPIEGDR